MPTKPNALQFACNGDAESIGPAASRNCAIALREIVMENEPQRKDLLDFVDQIERLYKDVESENCPATVDSVVDRGIDEGYGLHVVINAPEFFQRKDFEEYVESQASPSKGPVFTWHQAGTELGDYSDVVVLVEPCLSGDGSNSDMPEDLWNTIIAALQKEFGQHGENVPDGFQDRSIAVRLTNLDL